MLASFGLPFFILAFIYLTIGIYPGSSRSILASDAFSQFSNFHASFRNAMLGKQSFLYSWHASLGLNYLSLISYYLGGVFTPFVLFFPNQLMPDALYFLTLLKVGSAGLAFWFYAKHTFAIDKWAHVTLAVSYALMSFIIAHSEIIMWIDALIYLPLIIWGIDRLLLLQKPRVLFFSYLLLFISSFYMGFMIGIFSVLYFLVRLISNFKTNKSKILPYGITSILAGGASMIIILPAVLDLRTNGEELTQITQLKTEATNFLDIFMKNMIGVYDTTKYGSIPFIYIGLLPLTFCLFYFVTKSIAHKEKILFAALFAILIASFYLVPLNLFWQGMHAPNMFLFRYAYLFSFLVIMLAGYGWEQFKPEYWPRLVAVLISLMLLFCFAMGLRGDNEYTYVKFGSFVLTICFLLLYILVFTFTAKDSFTKKTARILLLAVVCCEAAINTNGMVRGILNDWNYASRSLYTEPYPAIKNLVDQTKTSNQTFYRLENLDPVSSNDSFNYGYSGISMFSSIRNRHSSSYLDRLGFRSRGTNLNIRYANNTLLMDGFTGIKYNLTTTPLNKFGFKEKAKEAAYQLYENDYALPLAFLTDASVTKVIQPENDNLTSQTNLVNALSGENLHYFDFYPLSVVKTDNTTVTNNGNFLRLTEEKANIAKDITWSLTIPAHRQAYLSLYPEDFAELESSTVTILINGQKRKTQINISGQYYDLGYYDKETTITFTASFYGTKSIGLQNPQVVTLDTTAYEKAMKRLQQNGVPLTTGNRSATGNFSAKEDQLLITTIPFDKGWQVKIDGKKVPITAFQDAFLAVKVKAGKHNITLRYLPPGFILGVALFISCLVLFYFFDRFYQKKR
ncbi:copper ABC transporter permease [Enterococcus saigonensis]|uniref:Copper ABC transporter permease n=2 Tax=Enterococcus saigonensis TaxID=1805431 RepID=A0A679IF48_9ENTE|nr:copper ABC transporter permease [Enterococcus saigonensis]